MEGAPTGCVGLDSLAFYGALHHFGATAPLQWASAAGALAAAGGSAAAAAGSAALSAAVALASAAIALVLGILANNAVQIVLAIALFVGWQVGCKWGCTVAWRTRPVDAAHAAHTSMQQQ